MAEPYAAEGPRQHASWKGVPIVIQRRTLGTFVQHVDAGLRIEAHPDDLHHQGTQADLTVAESANWLRGNGLGARMSGRDQATGVA